MSAGAALQAAVARQLEAVAGLSGIYDGAPARAPFPYVAIDAGNEGDWSHKSAEGREVALGTTLWSDQPEYLHSLADAVEAAVTGVGSVEDWQLVSLRLLRRRMVRDVAGPWAVVIDFRARLLKAGPQADGEV